MQSKSIPAKKLLKRATGAFKSGKGDETIKYCQDILRSDPENVGALALLGKVYFAAGHYDTAAGFLQKSIILDNNAIESYILLARILEIKGQGGEAVKLMQRVTQIAPQNIDAHSTLVSLFTRFNHAHIVPQYLERIMPLVRDSAELMQHYAMALKMNERQEDADRIYQDLISRYDVPAEFRITYETYLPRVNFSVAEIEENRRNFAAALDRFIAEKPQINVSMLTMHPLFALSYHNRDNKELMRKYTQMLRVCAPELNYTAPHCKTPSPDSSSVAGSGKNANPANQLKIGFISRHLHDHPVGRCYRNIIVSLHKSTDIGVILFLIDNIVDDKIRELQAMGIEVVALPRNIKSAQRLVAERRLDIAVYPDIGIDATTHYMAMARLAHYQCCLPGHPDTTGIDTIDYFISSQVYEVADAQENYTETLLLNRGLDTIFTRPQKPDKWHSRSELGLPEGKKLYVCPMAIQKFHPDFDDILAGILDRDKDAVLVLFNDSYLKSASTRLQQRITGKCPADRVIFLGWQPMDKLLSCMKQADAVLSTIYFAAGTTAQYAFAFGIPMVSMPDRYLRSRPVHIYYEAMGIDDPPTANNPQQYIEMAVKLANDTAYRQKLSQQILDNNSAIFAGHGYEDEVVRLMRNIAEGNYKDETQAKADTTATVV